MARAGAIQHITYVPTGEETSTFFVHSANCYTNESKIAVALPKEFFEGDVEVIAHGSQDQQDQAKKKPLRMQAPKRQTAQNIAVSYGYKERDYGMSPDKILDHDREIHLAFRIGRRGARILARVGRDDAEIKLFYLGKRMHSNKGFASWKKAVKSCGGDMVRTLALAVEVEKRRRNEEAKARDEIAEGLTEESPTRNNKRTRDEPLSIDEPQPKADPEDQPNNQESSASSTTNACRLSIGIEDWPAPMCSPNNVAAIQLYCPRDKRPQLKALLAAHAPTAAAMATITVWRGEHPPTHQTP